VGHSLPVISFSKAQILYSFEDDMTTKNIIPQSSRKVTRSTSQETTITGVASSRVMNRNMAKAVAAIATRQSPVIVPPRS